MSSILSSLNMSLDDLIAKKKTSGASKSARGKDSAGPMRGSQKNRTNRRNQPYGRSKKNEFVAMDVEDEDRGRGGQGKRAQIRKKGSKQGNGSILERLGGAAKPKDNLGTKIFVRNLKFDVLEDDVRELFGTVGEVTKTEIVYDKSGRSKGRARVWFKHYADAEKAIKQYDGRELDGTPMQISIDEPKNNEKHRQESGDGNNVRLGLFGTALANRGDDDVKFKVSFGGQSGGNKRQDKRRTGGRGRGDRRGDRSEKSLEDLDNEMDTYMKDS